MQIIHEKYFKKDYVLENTEYVPENSSDIFFWKFTILSLKDLQKNLRKIRENGFENNSKIFLRNRIKAQKVKSLREILKNT